MKYNVPMQIDEHVNCLRQITLDKRYDDFSKVVKIPLLLFPSVLILFRKKRIIILSEKKLNCNINYAFIYTTSTSVPDTTFHPLNV